MPPTACSPAVNFDSKNENVNNNITNTNTDICCSVRTWIEALVRFLT